MAAARTGKSLSENKGCLENNLRTLKSLMSIRDQVQADMESVSRATKRVASFKETREIEKSRSVNEFNKVQLNRFNQAVIEDRLQADTELSRAKVNRVIALENAKHLAASLSKKYLGSNETNNNKPRQSSASLPDTFSTKPSSSSSSINQSSAPTTRSSSRRKAPLTVSVIHPKESNEFKYIDIPANFHILSSDKENIRDFVNRIAPETVEDDQQSENLSDVRRSITDLKQGVTATFSERRDPSRAIERRRAALAAIRLRYAKNSS
jgi:hypothetical protein